MFWKTIPLLNQNFSSISTLSDAGNSVKTSLAKATSLNNFFYACFYHNQPPLGDTDPNFAYKSLCSVNCPGEFLHTEESVLDLLMKLDTSKSTSGGGISLKSTSFSIVHS